MLGDQIYLAKEGLPAPLRNRLIRLAAFQNPEFYRAQAMRLPTYEKPRVIGCAEDYAKHIGLPRGCLEEILDLLRSIKIKPIIRDERFAGTKLDIPFHGHWLLTEHVVKLVTGEDEHPVKPAEVVNVLKDLTGLYESTEAGHEVSFN